MDQHPSQIVEGVEYTSEDALQAGYLNFNNSFKYAMFKVLEKELGEVVRYDRAPTVSEVEMHSLVQTKAVADMIVQSVLSHTKFIVPMGETVGKMMERAVDGFHLPDSKEAFSIAADTELMKKGLSPD